MAQNLMPEVAKLLGVEIGEKFIIENAEHNLQVVLVADGLHVTKDDFLGSSNSKLLQNVLCGLFEVKKLPWEPRYGDIYYIVDARVCRVDSYSWGNTTFDYAVKNMGIIYPTREEAEAHLAEDYEKLTGEKLEEQAIVKIPWEPKRGESYYAMSIVGCAQPKIACYDWNGSAADYECLKNGLVHKTQAEAEEHFAEDYERLTGKPLSFVE